MSLAHLIVTLVMKIKSVKDAFLDLFLRVIFVLLLLNALMVIINMNSSVSGNVQLVLLNRMDIV